jgi:sec-independent protein translocase protein TatB
MEILGIGPSELIFVVILAIIILGPKDMQKTGKTIGRWLNTIVRSDGWKAFQQTSKELRNMPTKLMRDANLEMLETERELRKVMDVKPSIHPTPSQSQNPSIESKTSLPLPQKEENTIQPPSSKPTESDPVSDEKVS